MYTKKVLGGRKMSLLLPPVQMTSLVLAWLYVFFNIFYNVNVSGLLNLIIRPNLIVWAVQGNHRSFPDVAGLTISDCRLGLTTGARPRRQYTTCVCVRVYRTYHTIQCAQRYRLLWYSRNTYTQQYVLPFQWVQTCGSQLSLVDGRAGATATAKKRPGRIKTERVEEQTRHLWRAVVAENIRGKTIIHRETNNSNNKI